MATNQSLTNVRQVATRLLGRYHFGTLDASGHSTTALVDSTLKSSLSVSQQWLDYYFAIPAAAAAADRVARVVASFAPSTGTLTIDRALSSSSIGNSAAYELHSLVEPTVEWPNAINDALRRIMVVTEITLTPTAQAVRHDLTTDNTWLINPAWVRQIGYLVTGETRANADPYSGYRIIRGWPDTDGADVYINHPGHTVGSGSGETWYIRVLKPAYAHCRASGGAYGTQSGLALETDEHPIEPEYLAWAAICMALEAGYIDLSVQADAQLKEKVQHAIAMCASYAKQWEVAHREDTTLKFTKLGIQAGPVQSWGGGSY